MIFKFSLPDLGPARTRIGAEGPHRFRGLLCAKDTAPASRRVGRLDCDRHRREVVALPLEQIELVPSVFFSALYASNLWFASQATDYLGGDVHTELLVHTWSLSVEEQFYLVWPLLILLGVRFIAPARIRRAVLITMSAVFVISLVASLWLITVSQPVAFFGSLTRAWEFAAGGLAFMVTRRVAMWSDGVKGIFMVLGFAAMAGAVVCFDDRTRFPGVAALLPVTGTALMITAGTGQGWMTRWLGTPVMQLIGNVSYSWYLWHWPFLVFPFGWPLDLARASRRCV